MLCVFLFSYIYGLPPSLSSPTSYGLNVIVGINKYITDTDKEIEYLKNKLEEKGVNISLVEAWAKGGEGAIDLAEKIVDLCEKPANFKYCYGLNDTIKEKIEKIATKKLPYKAKELPKQPTDDYVLPCLTSSFQNQGLNYYAPKAGATVLNNVISIPSNSDVYRAYYQTRDFTVLSDAYAIRWKSKEIELSQNDNPNCKQSKCNVKK